MLRRFLFASVLFSMLKVGCVFAAETVCMPLTLKTENKNFILPGIEKSHTKKVFVFKNISSRSIWLDHPEHTSASAGWSSYLRVNHASALQLNRKSFSLSCAVITPGNVEYLNCEKVVSVCLLSQEEEKSNHKGTFWLAEDKSWDDLMSVLTKKSEKAK